MNTRTFFFSFFIGLKSIFIISISESCSATVSGFTLIYIFLKHFFINVSIRSVAPMCLSSISVGVPAFRLAIDVEPSYFLESLFPGR